MIFQGNSDTSIFDVFEDISFILNVSKYEGATFLNTKNFLTQCLKVGFLFLKKTKPTFFNLRVVFIPGWRHFGPPES